VRLGEPDRGSLTTATIRSTDGLITFVYANPSCEFLRVRTCEDLKQAINPSLVGIRFRAGDTIQECCCWYAPPTPTIYELLTDKPCSSLRSSKNVQV